MTAGPLLHKLHGLGNDFLIALVDELPADVEGARTAVALCDRHRGVGADGLIYAVLKPAGGAGDCSAAMRLWNSDGSPAEVSGNGLRCLTHAVARTLEAETLDIVVHTVAGPRRCSIRPTGEPGTMTGTAEMGSLGPGPRPDRADDDPAAAVHGLAGAAGAADRTTACVGETSGPSGAGSGKRGTEQAGGLIEAGLAGASSARWETVDVGNPHIVLEVDSPFEVDLSRFGSAVESHFADGINVHFAALTDRDTIALSTWERGAGATEACGTGAVASAAVFHRWGLTGQNVTVRMAGGDAEVDLSGPVMLIGPSVYIAAVTVGHV